MCLLIHSIFYITGEFGSAGARKGSAQRTARRANYQLWHRVAHGTQDPPGPSAPGPCSISGAEVPMRPAACSHCFAVNYFSIVCYLPSSCPLPVARPRSRMSIKSNAAGPGSSPAAHFFWCLVCGVFVFMCQIHFFKRQAPSARGDSRSRFIFWACGGILDLRVAIVPPIRYSHGFSLTSPSCLVVVGT